MAGPEIPNSRRLATAEALIVVGMLVFTVPFVAEPIIGPFGWMYMYLAFAGIVLWLIGGLLVYGRGNDFVAYLSTGKDVRRALWRSRPVRQSAPILLLLFFAAIIMFQSEWSLQADQVAAIGIIIIVLSEVADRCLDAIRSD